MSIIEKLGITPGPWIKTTSHIGSRLQPFVSCNRKTMDGMHIHNGNDDAERHANAQLISAAPEMLEALIDIRKFMDRLPHDWYSEHRAENISYIIKKANGKSWEEIKALL